LLLETNSQSTVDRILVINLPEKMQIERACKRDKTQQDKIKKIIESQLSQEQRLHIAVGVILNEAKDKVLLSRRPDEVSQGGFWEFPGGKVEQGEQVGDALARELFEELNLILSIKRPLIVIDHDYPEYSITLDVWLVSKWHGDVIGREGQTIEWVSITDLYNREFPTANYPIVTAINLSPLYLISPNLEHYGDGFYRQIRDFLEAGVKLIQFRNKSLNPGFDRERVINDLLEICMEFDSKLIINAYPDEAIKLGVHGVHLTSSRLFEYNERPLSRSYWVAASCHNKVELMHACNIGVDFAVLSPICDSSSHPDCNALGWDKFTELTRQSTIPVYALGGMQLSDIESSQFHGGQGVAMISGIWNLLESGSLVRAYLT